MADLFQIQDKFQEKKASENTDRKKILTTMGIVIVGIVALGILIYFLANRCYTNYKVQSQVERSDSNNVNYTYFNNNILKYSGSGISALDNKGNSLWNGGFEMKQPQVDTCGNYVVVADINAKQFYVYNGEDEGKSMDTALPIVRAKVAGQGVVATLLQDVDSNVLNIYNPYSSTDNLLVEIPSNVSEEGYPVDFDISPDGQTIVIAYLIVKGNEVETQVNFYNFTDVGQDKNTLVGGKSFKDSMVSRIEFIGDDKVAIFHETGYSVFKGMKQPELDYEKTFTEEIRSMAFNDKYVAVVVQQAEKESAQVLHLYHTSGGQKMKKEITFEYSDMNIYRDEILFWSSHECHILRKNGREKFSCKFKEEIEMLYPTRNKQVYTLVDAVSIQKIKLTMK